jgi:hypothetical protein
MTFVISVEYLQRRIETYAMELAALEKSHSQLVAENRSRYARICGAIAELNALKTQMEGNKNDNDYNVGGSGGISGCGGIVERTRR